MYSIHHVNYKALQEHLRAMRVMSKHTQVSLAKALGIGQSYVSKIERGECYVDVLLYIDWCRCCGLKAPQALTELISQYEKQAGLEKKLTSKAKKGSNCPAK